MQGVFESLIDGGWVFAQFAQNTGEMIAWTVAVFIAGFVSGRVLAGRNSEGSQSQTVNVNVGDGSAGVGGEAVRNEGASQESTDDKKEIKRLQNLLGAEKTLSSAYKEKAARFEERLKAYENAEKRERERSEARERSERVTFREEVSGDGKAFVLVLYECGPRDMDGEQLSAVRKVMGDAFRYVSVAEMPGGTNRVSLREEWLEFFKRNNDLLDEVRSATEP